MPINHATFRIARPSSSDRDEMDRVEAIASSLLDELKSVSDEIDRIHRFRAKSDQIQATFFPWIEANFTVSIEKTEGFEDTTTRRNRPDAQIWLNADGSRRVLVEVERGGTVTNGHDLKDMWKAHLSPLVQHMFLIVPNTIEDQRGKPRSDQAFVRCSARIGSFFKDERTAVDVLSVHIFGYGADPAPRTGRRAAAMAAFEDES